MLATAAGALAASPAQPANTRPNILFYLPDQVRACELGCYGGGKNVPTPNMDRLASQGVRFTNAISTYPLCTPYRAMLQTGRYPALSGGFMNWINLPSTGQSLGDAFSRAGYRTAYIGKWHLAAGRLAGTLKRGVEPPPQAEPEFVPPGPMRMGYQHWAAYNFHANFTQAFYYRDTPQRLIMPRYETDSETDFAIDFMKQNQSSSQPFMMIVSPHPPHPPWNRHQTPASNLASTPKDLYWRPNVKGRNDAPGRDPHCYYAMAANVDENLGRLMRYLDESGLASNTILVVSSDHGEMLASQGRYNKMVPYCEAVDVPLMMRWPGHIRPGSVADTLYTPMDHFPTLASFCGFRAPDIVNGIDLSWAALGGSKGKERDAALMMNFTSHWDYPETGTEWPEWRGVRDKQYTYARWLNGPEELYDNLADPYQTRNLFDGRSGPAALNRMRSRLKDFLAEAHDEFLPGNRYASWLDIRRNVLRNALGPIKQ